MIKSLVILLSASALTMATPVFAETSTLNVSAYPQSRGGKVWGCTLEYAVVTEDYGYKQGAPVSLRGGINTNIVERDGAVDLRVSLKVIANDITFEGQKAQLIPFVPTSVFLVDQDGVPNSSSYIDSIESDTGGRIAVFAFDDAWVSMQKALYADRSISFVYNRHEGGQDVRVKIDLAHLSAEDGGPEVGRKALVDWGKCNVQLGQLATQKLGR